MTGVKIREKETFETALRRFNKKCIQAGLLKEIKRHQFFEKPSIKRKRKLHDSIRRWKKTLELNG
ncbi:30S ribosomal protein S21 [bacterium]|nr:30S ribosomal protein S21 [bacterium]